MDVLEEYCQAILRESTLAQKPASVHPPTDVADSEDSILDGERFEDPYHLHALPSKNPNKPSILLNIASTALKTTAFVCNKGGTGKTTACINIAGWLAKQKKRVLLIDMDPQASATTGLGFTQSDTSYSIADALLGIVTLSSLIQKTDSGVHLVPAKPDLLLAEREMILKGKSVATLQQIIGQMAEHFDHILIDAPAGHGLLTLNAVTAGDDILIPIDSSVYAKQSAETLLDMFAQMEKSLGKKIKISAVLVRDQAGLSMFRRLNGRVQPIKEQFAAHCLPQPHIFSVPYATVCDRAARQGITLAEYAPLEPVSQAFKKVARMIAE